MMPGENAGPVDGPLLSFLKALEAFDAEAPGFGHDIHGVELEDGRYRIYVEQMTTGAGEGAKTTRRERQ